MALKITRAFEPIEVKTIILSLYTLPGIGKTSTGFTAEKPLLLDFDRGVHRSKNRRDTVQVESWDEVAAIKPEDLAGYKTVVVDTVGRALDMMAVKLLRGSPKNGNGNGGLSLQGYGAMKTAFAAWLNQLRSAGLDVVLLAHCDEQKKGDDILERLDIQGASKGEVYKASDAMGRISIENRKRVLHFSPSDTSFGKNPAQFEPIEVPDFEKSPDFLAGVIAQTKEAINKLSAEQTEVAAKLAAWQALVITAKTADDFNALLPLGKDLDERIRENAKRVLVKAAKDAEIVFDAKAVAFVGKEPPPQAAPQPITEPVQPANDNTQPVEQPKVEAKKGKGKKEQQADLLAVPAGEERVPGAEG